LLVIPYGYFIFGIIVKIQNSLLKCWD